jgi:hypothetical protein
VRTAFVSIASLFLLICITLHTTGFYLVFHAYQKELKREMKQQLRQHLPENDIIMFTYNERNASLFSFEDENEFTYGGTMYDILKKEEIDGTTIFYCVDDKRETLLLQAFLKHQNTERSHKTKVQNICQFSAVLYQSSDNNNSLNFTFFTTRHKSFCTCLYPQNTSEVLKPPPQLQA